MNFTAMYVDIDENKLKQKKANSTNYNNYITKIHISEYREHNLIFKKNWDISPIPSARDVAINPVLADDPNYLHNLWHEIEPHIYNKTVVLHLANYQIKHLLDSCEYIKNFSYNLKTDESLEKPQSGLIFPNAFKDCKPMFFDYIDLFSLLSRLFIGAGKPNLNTLDSIFTALNVPQKTDKSVAIGIIFNALFKLTNTNSLSDLKHFAGITFGEARIIKSTRIKSNIKKDNVIEKLEKGDLTVEDNKLYVPCIPIDEHYENYRKYSFNDLKQILQNAFDSNYALPKGELLPKICQWFPNDYVVFDIETTGVGGADKEDIIEIAALKISGGTIVDKFHSLVAFDQQTSNGAFHINKIAPSQLQDAPKINNVIKDFINFIGGYTLIGHNISTFDIIYVAHKAAKFNLTLQNNYIDTLNMAKFLMPDFSKYSLNVLSDYFDIDYTGAHRALQDCLIEYALYKKMCHLSAPIAGRHIVINSNQQNAPQVDENKIANLNWPYFKDKTVVITGNLRICNGDRNKVLSYISAAGGIAKDNITKKTDYLISADSNPQAKMNEKGEIASTKITKARQYNIPIITEAKFYEFLGYKEND